MSTFPMVSVIILNYKKKELTARCLDSVFQTNYPNFEVVLVDNGSKDGSMEYLSKLYEQKNRFKIICLDKNYGFAEGNNIGFVSADSNSKYIAILNNDMEVDINWLSSLVEGMEIDPYIGAAQSLLIDFKDREVKTIGSLLSESGSIYLLPYKGLRTANGVKISYAAGGASIFRRDVIKRVGFFDKDFFIYCEDLDLGLRIWLIGYEIVCFLNSKVYHIGSATTATEELKLTCIYHNTKNKITFLLKNLEAISIFRGLATRISIDSTFTISLLLRGKIIEAVTILRGFLWVILNLKNIWIKRNKIQAMKKVPEFHLRKLKIIIDDPLRFPSSTILPFLKKRGYKQFQQWIFLMSI